MSLDAIISIATLVAIVLAIFLARRGAQRKTAATFNAGYEGGQADLRAQLGVSVNFGDVTYARDGSASDHNDRTSIDYDDDGGGLDNYDDLVSYARGRGVRGAVEPARGHRVLNAGRGDASGDVPVGLGVGDVAGPGRRVRVARAARPPMSDDGDGIYHGDSMRHVLDGVRHQYPESD